MAATLLYRTAKNLFEEMNDIHRRSNTNINIPDEKWEEEYIETYLSKNGKKLLKAYMKIQKKSESNLKEDLDFEDSDIPLFISNLKTNEKHPLAENNISQNREVILSDYEYNRIDKIVKNIKEQYYSSMRSFLLSIGVNNEPYTSDSDIDNYFRQYFPEHDFSKRYPERAKDPLYIEAIDAYNKRQFVSSYYYYDNFIKGVTTDMYKKYLEMKKEKEEEKKRLRKYGRIPGHGGGKKKLSKKKRKTRRAKKRQSTRKA